LNGPGKINLKGESWTSHFAISPDCAVPVDSLNIRELDTFDTLESGIIIHGGLIEEAVAWVVDQEVLSQNVFNVSGWKILHAGFNIESSVAPIDVNVFVVNVRDVGTTSQGP
jgi:hypothetical protein